MYLQTRVKKKTAVYSSIGGVRRDVQFVGTDETENGVCVLSDKIHLKIVKKITSNRDEPTDKGRVHGNV